jgi:hypothetical protein
VGNRRHVEHPTHELAASRLSPDRRLTLALAAIVPAGPALLYPSDDAIATLCAFSGFTAGLILYRPGNPVKLLGSLRQRPARIPIGIAGIAVMYMAVAALFPEETGRLYAALRYLRYALLGGLVLELPRHSEPAA